MSVHIPFEGVDPRATRSRCKAYNEALSRVDRMLGQVLGHMGEVPYRWGLVLASDHGQALDDYWMWSNAVETWEWAIRVPLVFYLPDLPARTVRSRRSYAWLCNSLAWLMLGRAPWECNPRQGELLSDLVPGPNRDFDADILVSNVGMAPGRQAVIVDNYKLVSSRGRVLGLFDLTKDPSEAWNLVLDRALLDDVIRKASILLTEGDPGPGAG